MWEEDPGRRQSTGEELQVWAQVHAAACSRAPSAKKFFLRKANGSCINTETAFREKPLC